MKVDVPLDLEFLKYTGKFFDEETPRFIFFDTPKTTSDKHLEQYENLKKIIKDDVIKENIGAFYRLLNKYCDITPLNTLDCANLGKAINSFESFLKNKTRQAYKIRLIADGNI